MICGPTCVRRQRRPVTPVCSPRPLALGLNLSTALVHARGRRAEALYERDAVLRDELVHEPGGHDPAAVELLREREVSYARLLGDRLDQEHEVQVFEASDHLGGHTWTVPVELNGRTWEVDTGFVVFNEETYPGLCALFEEL